MVLTPYQNYKLALPVLKAGHVIKAGAGSAGGTGFWVIKRVMAGRIKITETGVITKKQWIQKNGDNYRQVSGNIDTQKIVHLQYLACLQANDALIYWGKDPVFSFDYDGSIVNSTIAPDASPITLDKWSYDQSMFMSVSIAAAVSQDFIIETVVYEVAAHTGSKPRKYLEITSDGIATFVEMTEPRQQPAAPRRNGKVFRDEDNQDEG